MIFQASISVVTVQLLNIAHLLLIAVAVTMSIPVTTLFIQIFAALLPRQGFPGTVKESEPDATAVVVPAHDEGRNLLPTLQDILCQLGPRDRLLVVADNCKDDTAAVALKAGASVLVRNDSSKKGKGYALSHAVQELSKAPPNYVVIVDADCRLDNSVLTRLKHACILTQRPVQASDLMKQPPGSPADHRLSEFAWLVRNYVRPLGFRALGLPSQLMGTGMIFPWPIISSAQLATGEIVEDLNLGIDLAQAGKAPFFLPDATVTSLFPNSEKGAISQRERWISGHLKTILRRTPLLLQAFTTGNLDLFAMVLDLMVPPLSLLGFLLLTTFVASSVLAAFCGLTTAFAISTVEIFAMVAAIFVAWFAFGRHVCPLSAVFSAGVPLMARARVYFRLARGRANSTWVRTDREG